MRCTTLSAVPPDARRLSMKRKFERDPVPPASSFSTTTTAEEAEEEGDTSAPPVPKSHGSGEIQMKAVMKRMK